MVKYYTINKQYWFIHYIFDKDDIEMIPYQHDYEDRRIYLEDGIYKTEEGPKILIEDKKIIKML